MTIRLDDGQRSAAHADARRATNIVAGAGTGKTTVLVERFLKLVRDDGIPPDRILSLTFTLKAAAEMRHRIHHAVQESMPHLTELLYGAWIMNFHQFGLRLIRDNAPAFGIDPAVDVVSPAQFTRIRQLLKRRFIDGRIDGVPHDFGGVMPAPTKMESRFDLFFKAALRCRSDGLDAVRLRGYSRPDDHSGYDAWVESVIAIADEFGEELRRRNLIDFSAMIAIPAARLVTDDALRRRYAARFDHILVDEFQDTSRAQYELLRALSDEEFTSVTVVGDRKQSIYRWRDARVENVIDFPGDEEPLSTNYRSRQNILDIAHAFISTDDDFRDSTDNIPLVAHNGKSDYPIVLFHPEDDEDGEAEAAALAAWVRHLTDGLPVDGLPSLAEENRIGVEDVAVLMRSLKPSHGLPAIERAFERQGIPYAVIGGANAAETRALDLWHAAMSLLLPGNRVRELLTVLEGAPWNLPDAALCELIHDVKRREGGVDLLGDEDIARIGDERAAARVRELRTLIADLEARMVSSDFRSFIVWAIDESALAARLFASASTVMADRAVQDLVIQVLEAVEQVNKSERPSGLGAFLEHLRAAIDDKKFREESDVQLPSDRVRIMTVHQSKGLEFKAVAVAGLKPPFHGADRFFVSHEHGLFFSAQEAKDWGRGLADCAEFEHEQRMEAQETNCLLYVAMTRAEEFLWVSTPYRDGMRKKSESLFARLLTCIDGVDPVVVLRRPPDAGPDPVVMEAASEEPVSPEELAGAWAEWAAARARLEVIRNTVPPSPGEIDVVSWPELLEYRECPLRYRYRYRTRVADVLGIADDAVADPGTRGIEDRVKLPGGLTPPEYGVLVHDSLDRIYGNGAKTDAAVAASARLFPAGKVSTAATKSAARLVDGVRASEIGDPGAGVQTEEPFQVRFDSLVIQGVFDRIERVADGLRVIDYKVGVENPAHEFQAQVYAWALGRIDDAPVDGIVCYLREDRAHIRRVTSPETIAAVATLAESLEQSLKSGEFAATPGAVCESCTYRAVCPDAAS